MSSAATGKQYSIEKYFNPSLSHLYSLKEESTEQLQKWATDPNCKEAKQVAEYLAEREGITLSEIATRMAQLQEKESAEAEAKRNELQANPFDKRTEVSADAKYIAGKVVKHLWIIFVLLPIVLGLLFALLK